MMSGLFWRKAGYTGIKQHAWYRPHLSAEDEFVEVKLWQHPFVNLFKQFKVEDWKKCSKEGDVTSVLDRHVKCTVYKIQGSVPAGNYIQFPRTTSQSLGLTGRYLYILFKPIPTKYFVVHIDTVAQDGLVVRISFSNLFKEFKSTSTWLQFPFACRAAKGSVEHCASLGARKDFMGPAPLSQKWTMLVLDMQYILSVYINRKYSHMKNIRLCANILVKNCFTSDICYDPRLSVRQARLAGMKTVDENFAPMPRDMNFFVPKDKEWDELYDVVRFPLDPSYSHNHTPLLPFDSIQRDDDARENLYLSHKKKKKSKNSSMLGVMRSPRRDLPQTVDVSRKHGTLTSTGNIAASTNVVEDAKKKRKITSELPHVGLTLTDTTNASCSDPEVTLLESNSGDVHVFAGECPSDQEIVVHRHFPSKLTGKETILSTELRSQRTTFKSKGGSPNRLLSQKGNTSSVRRSLEGLSCLEPNPILKLKRVIGFGGGLTNDVKSYRSLSLWHPRSDLNGGNDIVVYAVHAVVVAMETANFHQHFFIGHTESVTSIAFNACQGNSPCILASAQEGAGGIVRIWRFDTQKCAAIIRSQHASGMSLLAFSQTGAVLVGVGRDGHNKTLFMVWNTSGALRSGTVTVIAKAHTDVEINRVLVCPTDDTRMVSCGRDNVRFWRIRSSQLRSCPAVLPSEHKLEEITDVKFAPLGTISAKINIQAVGSGDLSVYACTKAGYIIEIDYQKVTVLNMHKLYPSHKSDTPKDEPMKGISLNTLKFSQSYIATGSDDGVLRLWPLDLSAVFLEVEHEGPIVDIDVTSDGVKVLAATNVATLGYLDVSTRKYNTMMRSHTDMILDGCLDGLRRTISTCSNDHSIRVWDIDTLRQLYDFATPDDLPTTICCHPLLEIFACGFTSGAVRVFHVSSISVLSENTSTNGKVLSITFALSGQRLLAADEKGTLTIYDTSDIEHAGAPLLRSLPKCVASGHRFVPRGIACSPDDRRIAYIGPNEFTVTVASSSTLDELLRVDISTGLKLEPDILNQKPKVDAPLRLAFSPQNLNHLLVITTANRLLKLDSKTGRLLSVTEDMHRSKTSAMCVCDDGRHLVTAGDKLVKVWDYEMSKDISCQAFIGHSSPIHSLIFTPDRLKLISVGEDAVFMWNFLGSSSTPRDEAVDMENVISIGRNGRTQAPVRRRRSTVAVDVAEECPVPSDPPAPIRTQTDQSSAWVPPETLHTSDLDASNVSEFTVDARMMEKLVQPKTSSLRKVKGTDVRKVSERLEDLHVFTEKEDPVKTTVIDEPSSNFPVKVAWKDKPKLDLTSLVQPPKPTEVPTLSEKPNVLSHFVARVATSQAAQRSYTAPPGEEGLKLAAVIGYNGNGRDNLLWNPDIGILAYSCGCIVVLEKLAESEKHNLLGHTEEISCLAMQNDGQILASASASNGLVQSKICLWDVNNFSCRATLKHHDYDIVDLAYSRDDRFLISIGDYRENAVVVWSSFDGLTTPTVLACTKTLTPIHRVIWDPSTANEFVTVGSEAKINFWIIDEPSRKLKLNVHEADVPDDVKINENNDELVDFTSVCFGEDHTLFVGSSTGHVSAWDTNNNSCFLHWHADSAEITLMKSKGDRILVAGASRGVKIWSLVGLEEARFTGELKGDFVMENELSINAEIISGAFDDTLDMGVVGTTVGTIWYVDWMNKSTVRIITGHKDKINDIVFDEGSHFATCSEEGTVRLWNAESFELTVQFQVIDYACRCVAFSHLYDSALCNSMTQPKMLAAGYEDGTLRIFDLDKLILKMKLQPHSTSVTSVQFSKDNSTLLSGAHDGTVAATSLTTGVTLRVLKDHRGAPINNISCSLRKDHPVSLVMRDGVSRGDGCPRLSLVCGGDRRVSVWDTEWQHDVCSMIDWLTFPAPCFAPDGSTLNRDDKKSYRLLPPSVCLFHPTNPDLLVYCGYGMNKSVQLYSLMKRKVVKSLPLPNWAESMDISSQGHFLAIGTQSRLVELVDANHGTFQDFVGHSGEVEKMRFSPDGQLLISSSGNELFIWNVKQ